MISGVAQGVCAVLPYCSVSPSTLKAIQAMNTPSTASNTIDNQFRKAWPRRPNRSWNTSTRMWLRPIRARLKEMVEPTASA